jgi:periplasmic nitrate reductase NapD
VWMGDGMNLSGIVVVAKPQWLVQVVDALAGLPGVEVHQVEDQSGRIVVVQEAADIRAEMEALKRIQALPHVIMAEMVYHYFAEDDQVYEAVPAELAEEQTPACAVPAYLNH